MRIWKGHSDVHNVTLYLISQPHGQCSQTRLQREMMPMTGQGRQGTFLERVSNFVKTGHTFASERPLHILAWRHCIAMDGTPAKSSLIHDLVIRYDVPSISQSWRSMSLIDSRVIR